MPASTIGNVTAVANAHGVPMPTLHAWVGKVKRRNDGDDRQTLHGLRKKLADAELEISVLKELLKKNEPSVAQRVEVVKAMVTPQRSIALLLRFAGVPRSSWYYDISQKLEDSRADNGRTPPGYTVNRDGALILDVSISSLLTGYRQRPEFHNACGYKFFLLKIID